jgi:hypothetical protein
LGHALTVCVKRAEEVHGGTAADYRKWAEECFEWARAASDECVREQYAQIGQVWLERAARAELPADVKIAQPEPKTTQKVA